MATTASTALRELHRSLDGRSRPEEIADLIRLAVPLDPDELAVVSRVAERSWRRRPSFSSMSDDFRRPDSADRQAQTAARLFGQPPFLSQQVGPDFRPWAAQMGEQVDWHPGASFKGDRRNRDGRRQFYAEHPNLTPISKRQWNRRFRALRRLDDKLDSVERAARMRRLVQVGHSGFAVDIGWPTFQAAPYEGCFVAYWTARRNLRRMFTLDSRTNPFDQVCEVLLARCEARGDVCDWLMLAAAYPVPRILRHLDDDALGQLMGRWTAVMRDTADLMAAAIPKNLDRRRMIVRRGMDSSTWNTMAGAFNAARSAWLALVHTIGCDDVLEVMCPGKALRLMAADLAWWHQSAGSDLDPDTAVWAALPPPWEVLAGTAVCTRGDIEKACDAVGVDPVARGWTAPRPPGGTATFTPTPELVHGVAVADPVWAGLLRRAGVFSGQRVRPELLGGVSGADIDAQVISDRPGRRL